ncbi:MAG: uracil-DNA glycosylase [Candidatus Omnitrophota bacterium]
MSVKDELIDIIRSIESFVELQKISGIDDYLKSDPGHLKDAPQTRTQKTEALESLEMEVLSCKRCGLCATRNNVVFGSGDPDADLMFVGEAPGHDEDLQGLPFVGRAGGLLTKIIEAMGLKRKDVYIGNIIKCRPPSNRNPLPTEILNCEEYLIKQVDIIKPKVICTLGKFSAQTLLKTQEPISKLRGNSYSYHGIKLMPTFHPAYLLRNPAEKIIVWQDMQKIMSVLGLNVK